MPIEWRTILAGYCVVTALLWKQFWKAPDFRLRGTSGGRDIFWDFLKNLALAGGFLALAFGASAAGWQGFLAHPLASSHPYAQSPRGGRLIDNGRRYRTGTCGPTPTASAGKSGAR